MQLTSETMLSGKLSAAGHFVSSSGSGGGDFRFLHMRQHVTPYLKKIFNMMITSTMCLIKYDFILCFVRHNVVLLFEGFGATERNAAVIPTQKKTTGALPPRISNIFNG